MVALAAWLLLSVLLGACAGSGGLGDRIRAAMLAATIHPEEKAVVLYEAGKYAQAELYAKEALERAEDPYFTEGSTLNFFAGFLSLASPGLGTSLNNLAMIYEKQGRYAEAEPLYQRALAIREEALGPNHPAVGNSLNNLATLYAEQGRYAEAEPLFERALAIREKALGRTTGTWPQALNSLAEADAAHGDLDEAMAAIRRIQRARSTTGAQSLAARGMAWVAGDPVLPRCIESAASSPSVSPPGAPAWAVRASLPATIALINPAPHYSRELSRRSA